MTVDNEPRGVPPGVPASMITPTGNMPAIGVPNTQDYARLIFSAPYFEQIPIAEIIQPSVTEAVENALPSLIPPYVDQAVLAGIQQYAVLLTGSTMSGPLFLSPLMPTADSQAATKAYVDAMLATAGIPEVPPVPQGQIWARETGQWVPISQSEGTFLPLTGGTMGGSINMSGNTITNMAAVPAMPNGAAPAQWVLNQIASVSLYQGTWDADTNTPDLTQLSTHVNAYTWIAITTSVSGVVIGAAIPGLQGMTIFNGDTIIYSTAQGQFSAIHAGGLTLPEADARYVQLAGSQMSGALLLNSNATQNMQAVTFQQLEAAVANTVTPDAPADGQAYLRVGVGTNRWVPGLPLAGGILTGALTLAGNATAALNPVPLQQMTSAITAAQAGLLPIAGGTMTGPIILAGNATVNLNPVPLQQVNGMLGAYLPLTGGTLTGTLNGTNLVMAGSVNSTFAGGVQISGANGLNVTGGNAVAIGHNFVSQIAGDGSAFCCFNTSAGAASGIYGSGNGGRLQVASMSGTGAPITNWAYFQSNGLLPNTDNTFTVGYTGQALFSVDSYAFNNASDPRAKKDIGDAADYLGVVNAIAVKHYHWLREDSASPLHIGWLGNDVRAATPGLATVIVGNDEARTLALNSMEMTAILWKAVQELAAKVEALG